MTAGATLVRIVSIRTDGGTQSRASMDDEVVEDYVEKLSRGVKFPPLEVFYDGTDHWLVDGFHRFEAYGRTGAELVSAIVHQGSQRDAVLYSCGVNDAHGKPRSREDRRRAIEKLLRDEEWGKRGDRWIAEQCRVAPNTVGAVRRGLESAAQIAHLTERVGQDGKTYPVPQRRPTPEPEARHAPQAAAPAAPVTRPVPVAAARPAAPVAMPAPPVVVEEDDEDEVAGDEWDESPPGFHAHLAAREVDLAIGEIADRWPENVSRTPLIAVLNTWMRRLQRDEARMEGVSYAD